MDNFPKGAYLLNVHGEVVRKVKQSVNIGTLSAYMPGVSMGDMFIVRPRGSPGHYRLYEHTPYGIQQVYKHAEIEPVMAYAALTRGL